MSHIFKLLMCTAAHLMCEYINSCDWSLKYFIKGAVLSTTFFVPFQ